MNMKSGTRVVTMSASCFPNCRSFQPLARSTDELSAAMSYTDTLSSTEGGREREGEREGGRERERGREGEREDVILKASIREES